MTTKRRQVTRSVRILPTGIIRIQVAKVIRYYARVFVPIDGTFLVRLDNGSIYPCNRERCGCKGDRPRRPCKHRRAMIALADQGKIEF